MPLDSPFAALPGAVVVAVLLAFSACQPPDDPDAAETDTPATLAESERRPMLHGSYPELVDVPQRPGAPGPPGLWREFRTHRFDPGLDERQREAMERLEAIGYLSGSSAPGGHQVTTHLEGEAFRGLNLYTSGHGPEAVLTDMDGRVLHRWRLAFRDVWPDYPVPDEHPGTQFWRRAHLYENGDLLVIFEGLGLARIDARSKLVWANSLRAHHDLQVTPDGDIYVLTREARLVPRVNAAEPVLEDFIVVLDAGGEEKHRVSLLAAAESSGLGTVWEATVGRSGDLYHTNTLEVLDGSIAREAPPFREGNVLVHILTLGVTAVVDMEREAMVWMRAAGVEQHDPKILPNGNMLVFRNQAGEEVSSVIEYRSVSDEVIWTYRGSKESPFYSKTCGAAQRLPNGNTLITESDAGRAFEVTREGRIVWEFFNPHRAGEDNELIATLFELLRVPATFPVEWATGDAAP